MILVILAVLCPFVVYRIYAYWYFRSDGFNSVKDSVRGYIQNCNELNEHIDHLKSAYADVRKTDQGNANLLDNSVYNMKRRRWTEIKNGDNTYNCSAAVVKSATDQPFKYLCKYFSIKADESCLEDFESVLNDFAAAEQGKILLNKERDAIIEGINGSLSSIIMAFSRSRVVRELGFRDIDLSSLYFPAYTFQYVSAGGNSSSKCVIRLDVGNLDTFVIYLNGLIKFRKSVAGQRALMTSKLREAIKRRDNFTCRICNLSTNDERNLLLEVDHIHPLSRGGVTSEKNLQTLCWRCNRTKGAKVEVTKESLIHPPHSARQSGQQALH